MRRISAIVAAVISAGVLVSGVPAVASPTPTQAVGTVLETTELPRELWLDGTGTAQRMTYVTTDRRGTTPSTGAVFVPPGQPPEGGWPVIAWAHGTVGDSDFDAPSVMGEDLRTRQYVANWLGRGYAVAATDYVGLGTPGVPPYLDGRTAAHAVIDSVRAAREVEPTLSSRWAVVGLSQGGHAAVFTANLATEYAPELDYLGAAATGVPSNIETASPFAGPFFPPPGLSGLTNFMTFVIAGMRDVYPELDIDTYLTPLGRSLVDAAPEIPYAEFKKRTVGVSVAQMLSRSLDEPDLQAAIRDYLAVPVSGFDKPLFIAQGVADQVVPFPMTIKLVGDMRAAGSTPDFRMYPGQHVPSLYTSEADQVAFIENLFRG
ncbi:lipase family protein [Rhodococcus sp. NPDC058521]|uniref:lipase family protein n=1 Tax=Rhodococcus sp. NPDC058521 TaxID=3346536 RepID=UPI00364F647F